MIIQEIKFYKGAKRLEGERESDRNDSGANGKVDEMTRIRSKLTLSIFSIDHENLSIST